MSQHPVIFWGMAAVIFVGVAKNLDLQKDSELHFENNIFNRARSCLHFDSWILIDQKQRTVLLLCDSPVLSSRNYCIHNKWWMP